MIITNYFLTDMFCLRKFFGMKFREKKQFNLVQIMFKIHKT
jgi:hypothetical protein